MWHIDGWAELGLTCYHVFAWDVLTASLMLTIDCDLFVLYCDMFTIDWNQMVETIHACEFSNQKHRATSKGLFSEPTL